MALYVENFEIRNIRMTGDFLSMPFVERKHNSSTVRACSWPSAVKVATLQYVCVTCQT